MCHENVWRIVVCPSSINIHKKFSQTVIAWSPFAFVGTNSENGSVTAQYSWAGEIPQGPTFNPAKSGSPDQAKSHSQKAERSYVDVVRGNRSTHSIELIN